LILSGLPWDVSPRVCGFLDRQGSFDKAVCTKPLAHSRLCISNGIVSTDGLVGAGGDAGTDEPENSLQASMLNAGAANFVAMTWKTAASLSQAHLNQACRSTQPTRH
jgi:hypothetical protein